MVEVLAAMVIFTIGALGLMVVIPQGVNRVTDSSVETRASALATTRCEQLLTTPYDDVDLDPGDHEDPANPHAGVYLVRWTVEADQPLVDCKRVTVNVSRIGASTPLVEVVIVKASAGG